MVNIAVVWLATNIVVCSLMFYFMWLHTLDTIQYILLLLSIWPCFLFTSNTWAFMSKYYTEWNKIHTMKLSHMNQHYLLWWSVFQIFCGILYC